MNAGPQRQTMRQGARADHRLIAELVEPGSRLLDIGCGDGALLELLAREKNVDGRGIEISQEGVNASVRRGLSVIQGDAETDLADYPDAAFDYVVLSQTLPAIRDPKGVLLELLRIGRSAIVSIPNFGHWRNRLQLLTRGRMPARAGSGELWYETPVIRPCTIKDFVMLCRELDIGIERRTQVDSRGGGAPLQRHRPLRQPLRRAGGLPALRRASVSRSLRRPFARPAGTGCGSGTMTRRRRRAVIGRASNTVLPAST